MTEQTHVLAACPCGRTPARLQLNENGQGAKWATATGDCCGEWGIEFRTMYWPLGSAECMELAAKTWNESPRGF